MLLQAENKREHERYPVSLEVHVSAFDERGMKFSESGILRDISGGGANLIVDDVSHYYIGQRVDVQMCEPGLDKCDEEVDNHGMVVWIGGDPEGADDAGRVSIGICMNDLQSFSHIS